MSLPNGKQLFAIPKWKLASGSQLLIEGQSGSGKTTFLHMIAGLFPPDAGKIEIGGVDFSGKKEKELCRFRREKVGIVFQKLNLIEHLTAAENIALGLLQSNDKAIRDSLSRLGMQEKIDEICSHLSQGEQQRIAVARVLAAQPELILADEPTSSLDEKNARFVAEALRESAAGKTLLVVSHDQRIRDFFPNRIRFEELCR